ncbi:piggyBac transposable element-derived protein 4-like [Amyelois transitella]|uniref:piggyBac transposable element-derived protein 4-like n=1 Tax=Amyelois transitella TaxID=680683 RepID=UPI00298F4FE8|nr:piggyBac transposable element-derived protein 4-like [Amyelois transitella]
MSESEGSSSRKRKCQTEKNRHVIPIKSLETSVLSVMEQEDTDSDFSQFDDSDADPNFVLEEGEDTNSEQSELEAEDISDMNTQENQNMAGDVNLLLPEASIESGMDVEVNISPQNIGDSYLCLSQVPQSDAQCHTQVPQPVTQPSEIPPRNYYGRNRYKWSSVEPIARNTRTQLHNVVHMSRRLAPSTFNNLTELWELFITNDMLTLIVTFTNKKIEGYRAKYKDQGKSELRATTEIEMRAFFGFLYYTAVFKSNRENSDFIFATDGSGREIFRCVMSKHRFLVLLHCLRFDDADTRASRLLTDKIAAISEILQKFIQNCQSNYTLGTHVYIDEMLIAFRGRCKFIIYLPSKPAKYGIKMLLLVDARTFYIYNAYIYYGKGSDGEGLTESEKKLGVPTQSLLHLCKVIEGTHRNVTADNYFSSIEAVECLTERGLTYLGTLKKNKREIPPEFQAAKNRKVGEVLYGFTKDITIISYVPKPNRVVLVISSMHHNKETDLDTQKPAIIIDYNHTKGGVDEVDKKCANYSCSRRTRRWPMVIFYRLLDMSGVNAYILYKDCENCENTKPMNRGDFLRSLARELVLPQLKLRVYNDRIPRELRFTIQRIIGKANMPPAPSTASTSGALEVRKTCAICPSKMRRRTKYFCCICSTPMCLSCCNQICNDCK